MAVVNSAFYPLSARAKLNLMLIATNPTTKSKTAHLFDKVIFETLYKSKPANMLINPHITFTVDGDKPLPGGFANGVGKLSPEIPWIK